jgi:hypothetical protein
MSSAPFAPSGVYEVLGHKLVNVVVVAIIHAVDVSPSLPFRALNHGNLFAPRDESRNTKRELRFRALLSEHDARLSLTLA